MLHKSNRSVVYLQGQNCCCRWTWTPHPFAESLMPMSMLPSTCALMRRSKIFLQMVATQHLDQHWSRDLQVWVCLLLPPLQCGQGLHPGTPWKASHPTAARKSNSSARGCCDDRMSAPGSVCTLVKFSVNICTKEVLFFFFEFELLRSQPWWVTFCHWRVKKRWFLVFDTSGTQASLVYNIQFCQKRYFFLWFWAPGATVSK